MVGPREVRLTKVITVHTGRMAREHNTRPNWVYGRAALQPFDLIIEAEAGENIGNSGMPYNVYIHVVNLTNCAPGSDNLNPAATPIPETFIATNWSYDTAAGLYSRQWKFTLVPIAANQYHIFQYLVSLVDPALRRVACTLASEPFLLT
jgi:hypothetical protein